MTGSNMQHLPPLGVGSPSATVQNGGGGYGTPGGVQAMRFRDPVDAARSMMGNRIPSAEYPDGYLGTIQSRREDRLLSTLKNNLNKRSYQRGVHKGERIEAGDYFWPPEFDPMSGVMRGLDAEVGATPNDRLYYVERQSPAYTTHDRLTVMGQRLPRGAEGILLDSRAISQMDRLRPAWS